MKPVYYTWRGQEVTLTGLFQRVKKRRGKARILAGVRAAIAEGQTLKIVFVRDRRKKNRLAPLTTDIIVSDADAVGIYGKRWDIEAFFARCDELRDITLVEALHRMLTLAADEVRKTELASGEPSQNIIDTIMGTIIKKNNLLPVLP